MFTFPLFRRRHSLCRVVACASALLIHQAGTEAAAQAPGFRLGLTLISSDSTMLDDAFVQLLSRSGDVLHSGFSRGGGNISFAVPEGGRYGVFVRLFGHADCESPELDLRAARDTTVQLIVPLVPIGLEEIGVSSRGRCGTPRDGRELVRRYDLMKQSLAEIIRVDSAELVYVAQLVRGIFGRRLDRGNQRRWVWPDTSRVRTTGPLVSPSPDSVAMFGFAVRDPDEMARVFAPTPAILTSEAFLLSHCFGIADESDASRIGLTFRPLRGVQHVDVEGTVWMDADSGDVVEIEFTFTGIMDFLTPDVPRIMAEARSRYPNSSRLRLAAFRRSACAIYVAALSTPAWTTARWC